MVVHLLNPDSPVGCSATLSGVARQSSLAIGKAMLYPLERSRVGWRGGPSDGGVLTGKTIYEWDKTNGVLLSGSGVTRKPGATTAYQHSEGKISLIIADGKIAGSTFSGRGRITMASGAASSLQGKTYSYAGKTIGPGQFTIDVKYD